MSGPHLVSPLSSLPVSSVARIVLSPLTLIFRLKTLATFLSIFLETIVPRKLPRHLAPLPSTLLATPVIRVLSLLIALRHRQALQPQENRLTLAVRTVVRYPPSELRILTLGNPLNSLVMILTVPELLATLGIQLKILRLTIPLERTLTLILLQCLALLARTPTLTSGTLPTCLGGTSPFIVTVLLISATPLRNLFRSRNLLYLVIAKAMAPVGTVLIVSVPRTVRPLVRQSLIFGRQAVSAFAPFLATGPTLIPTLLTTRLLLPNIPNRALLRLSFPHLIIILRLEFVPLRFSYSSLDIIILISLILTPHLLTPDRRHV